MNKKALERFYGAEIPKNGNKSGLFDTGKFGKTKNDVTGKSNNTKTAAVTTKQKKKLTP